MQIGNAGTRLPFFHGGSCAALQPVNLATLLLVDAMSPCRAGLQATLALCFRAHGFCAGSDATCCSGACPPMCFSLLSHARQPRARCAELCRADHAATSFRNLASGSVAVKGLLTPNTSPKQYAYFDNAQTAQMDGGVTPLSATWCAEKNCAEEASIPPRRSRAGGREGIFTEAACTHSRRHLQFLKIKT